jgi:hypothetical protein
MADQENGTRGARVSPRNLRRAREYACLPWPEVTGYLSEIILPLNLLLVHQLQQYLDDRHTESPWIFILLGSQVDIFVNQSNQLSLDEWGGIWGFRDGCITPVGRISTTDPTPVSGPWASFVVQDDRPQSPGRVSGPAIHFFEGPGNVFELETFPSTNSNPWSDDATTRGFQRPRAATVSGAETGTRQTAIWPYYDIIQHSPAATVSGVVEAQQGNAFSPPFQSPSSFVTNPWSPSYTPAPMVIIADRTEAEAQHRDYITPANKRPFPVYDRNFDVGVTAV